MKSLKKLTLICTAICLPFVVYAEEGEYNLLSTRELFEQGKYLPALLQYKKAADHRTLSDLLYGAKSAWALSLVNESRAIWDEVLAHKECQGTERARALLAKALLEYQEGYYDKARGNAEDGASLLPESELRGELWFVIGETLVSGEFWSLAEPYYEKALREANKERKQETLLRLAKVRERLGKRDEARKTLIQIELTSDITPRALQELLAIDGKSKNSSGVRTWVSEGRSSYPSQFNDPEVNFLLISALLKDDLSSEASMELSKSVSSSNDSNIWNILSSAELEQRLAEKQVKTEATGDEPR